MENKKRLGSFASAADLLGSKKSSPPPSVTGIFTSIFPPPSSVVCRNCSSCSDLVGFLQDKSTRDEVWSSRLLTSDIMADKSEGPKSCKTNEEKKSIFPERVETSPLSSSLYYGGQEDMYICSSSTKSSSTYPFTKQGVEDDSFGPNSASACRGNWWQGSLYY